MFFRVVRIACDMCSDPIELWFCHIQSVRTLQAHTYAKTSKNKRPEAPKPIRNPLKSKPERPQTHQNRPISDNKRSKKRKARPRSAQERKIVPTWSSRGLTKFESVERLGPPKVPSAGIKLVPAFSAYWSDTPGHREQCGGFWTPGAAQRIKDL